MKRMVLISANPALLVDALQRRCPCILQIFDHDSLPDYKMPSPLYYHWPMTDIAGLRDDIAGTARFMLYWISRGCKR
jgi:hypothetical protein